MSAKKKKKKLTEITASGIPIVSLSFEYRVMYESTPSPLPALSARMVSGIRAKIFAKLF